jgi:hypothetical protein
VYETDRQLRRALLVLYGLARFIEPRSDEEREALEFVQRHLEDTREPCASCGHDRNLHDVASPGVDDCLTRLDRAKRCSCRLFVK